MGKLWPCGTLLCVFVAKVCAVNLLGLQLSVPALEKDGALNLLGSSPPPQGLSPQPYPTQVPEVLNRIPELPCSESQTRVNGGQLVCSGALLFEDHFNSGQLNFTKWGRQQYIAGGPDYEFVTYEKRAQNCFIKDGVLHLKATMREDPTVTKIDLTNGCTGKICSISISPDTNFLAPIVAGKIKSKFSFLYGRVDIRAQLPQGDWIFPQVNLDPKGQFSYSNGRLWVAYSRGNQDLKRPETEEQIGNTVLYSGGVLDKEEPTRTYAALKIVGEENWGNNFHIYSLIWTPDGIKVLIDDKEKGHINPPFTNSGSPDSIYWQGMAPFNQEFEISLGIAAGGFSDFPEGSTSSGNLKPWKKLSVRPMVNFYKNKNEWYPTWAGDNSVLKVDYVKVWAL